MLRPDRCGFWRPRHSVILSSAVTNQAARTRAVMVTGPLRTCRFLLSDDDRFRRPRRLTTAANSRRPRRPGRRCPKRSFPKRPLTSTARYSRSFFLKARRSFPLCAAPVPRAALRREIVLRRRRCWSRCPGAGRPPGRLFDLQTTPSRPRDAPRPVYRRRLSTGRDGVGHCSRQRRRPRRARRRVSMATSAGCVVDRETSAPGVKSVATGSFALCDRPSLHGIRARTAQTRPHRGETRQRNRRALRTAGPACPPGPPPPFDRRDTSLCLLPSAGTRAGRSTCSLDAGGDHPSRPDL